MSDVLIELVGSDGADEVSALLEASGLGAWEGEEDGAELLVARGPSGEVVGCGALVRYGEVGLLRSIAVAAERRGTGLGRELVDSLLALPAARRLTDVYLLTTTAPGFFEKLGFERIEREHAPAAIRATEQYRTECPASAVVMRRRSSRVRAGPPPAPPRR